MSRVSFKEFSQGLPVTQTNPKPPRKPENFGQSGNLIGRILVDAPSDIAETFKGIADAGMGVVENVGEALTRPGLSISQRAIGAAVAPFSGVVNAGGEALMGGAKLFTTDEFEENTNRALAAAGQAAMNTKMGMSARRFYERLPDDQKFMLTNVIAPLANVMTAGVGTGVAKAGAEAVETGFKGALKSTATQTTKRTAQDAANDVIAAANPINEAVEATAKGNPLVDTVKGVVSQFRDFGRRTIGNAQDTARQNRELATMPEPKSTLIRNGADERVVGVVEKLTPSELKVTRELVEQAKLKELDPTQNTPQPKIIAGREFMKPVTHIIETRKKVGSQLGEIRNTLSQTRDIDTNPAFRNFHNYLKNNFKVQFDKKGKIRADAGTLATSDIPQIQKIYDQLRSDKKNSQAELDQWLQRTYKDYDLVQQREKTFSEEVPRIVEFARAEVSDLMPDEYNALRTQYAQLSKPLEEVAKLLQFKGNLDDLTAKELRAGEVALRVLGNAADRPQTVIENVLKAATESGYTSDVNFNNIIYLTDQLEDLYDITPNRGFSGSTARGIDQSSVNIAGDIATMNAISLFDRAMSSKASQKEIQAAFEAYVKFLDKGGDSASFKAPKPPTETPDGGDTSVNIIKTVPKRDSSLTGRGAEIQEASIAKYEADPQKMVNDYLEENGNVINTDDARKLFADVGYNGTNSATVHEAASAVSKSAWREALAKNPGEYATIFAGGSGTGKTSVAQNVTSGTIANSAAVLDGNLSKIDSALERIKEAKDAGKKIALAYVYREPEDAWVNGVIARMLNNPNERGRVVPLSTFLQNHKGSYETIKKLLTNEDVEKITLLDNSFGAGKHQLMDVDKLNNLSYDIDAIRSSLLAKTKELYDKGKITEIQYKSLIK